MFMQTHQEILYLKEIFQNVHLPFLDTSDHLHNHTTSIDDTKTTIPRTPTSQDHLKGEIIMSIFGSGSSG